MFGTAHAGARPCKPEAHRARIAFGQAIVGLTALGKEERIGMMDRRTGLLWFRRGHEGLVIFALAAIGITGCRETEAPRTHFKDLGTGDTVLLPTFHTWQQPEIAKGQAEWHPYRPFDPNDQGAAPTATANADAGGGSGSVEAELRAMVADYNKLIGEDGDDGELSEFFVEAQQGKFRDIRAAVRAFQAKLKELGDALAAKDLQGGEVVTSLLTRMDATRNLLLDLKVVTVQGEAAATGEVAELAGLASLPTDVRFVLADEYWYIDLPAIDVLAGMLPAIQAATSQFDTLIQSVSSGQLAADTLTTQLEAMAATLAPAGAATTPEANAQPTAEDENDG